MDLTRMSRHELGQLQEDLAALVAAADRLAKVGMEPEISLTLVAARIECRPVRPLREGDETAPVMFEEIEIEGDVDEPSPLAAPWSLRPAISPAPDWAAEMGAGHGDTPDAPGADLMTDPPARAEPPEVDRGGAGETAGVDLAGGGGAGLAAPPAAVPAEPRPQNQPQRGAVFVGNPSYTEAVDAEVIQLVVDAMAQGQSMNAAIRAAAAVLGRGWNSLQQRVYKILKPRIEEALAALPDGRRYEGLKCWTAAEEAIVLSCVAEAQAEGRPVLDGIKAASARIGRAVDAVRFRWNKNLKARAVRPTPPAAKKTIAPPPKAKAAPDPAPVAKSGATAPGKADATVPVAEGAVCVEAPAAPVVPSVVSAPVAPVLAPVAAPAPRKPPAVPPADLHGVDLRIWQHLEAVGHPKGWDVEADMDLVEAFGRGMKAPAIATDFGMDTRAVVDRYNALTACIRDHHGRLPIDMMPRFLAVLRGRLVAAQAAPQAASRAVA